jgi:hypothetical protein
MAAQASAALNGRFDLVCNLHYRVVADPHPERHRASPMGPSSGHFVDRYIVDLRARRYCDSAECAERGVDHIARVTARQIVFIDRPYLSMSVRRGDGEYRSRLEEGDRISITTGTCRRARFSGFPAKREAR